MKQLTFYGASDDLVEVEGPGGDEFPTDDGRFRLALPDGTGIRVEVAYNDEGTWAVAVAPLMDDPDSLIQRVPDGWRFWLYQGRGRPTPIAVYSMALVVECDDEAELIWDQS